MTERDMQPSQVSRQARPLDGRRLRSARTRQLIIEAYLALLRENPRIPTAASIAQRAGCSVRSIFERFPDLHALRVAATDEALLKASTEVAANRPSATVSSV
jgi:AcrR family transcriptional regulator